MRQKTAAVVGSGFGGLAAAIRLQVAGFATVLYEKLDKPGGRAYVFEDDGYTFDAGPTVVTAPGDIEELFALAGRAMRDYVELMPVRPMYRLFWEDSETFDYDHQEDLLLSEIRRISPRDVDGYRRFYDYAQGVYEEGYVKLCHVPFLRFWDMVRVAPQLLKVSAQVPVYKTVSRFFEHEKLRQAFSFNSLLIGGNPFKASSIYTLIHPLERRFGVHFPRGGTGALVRGLAKLFQDIGGELRLSTGVERIETSGGRVRGVCEEGGRRQAFDVVVSNADVTTTYDRLLHGEPLAKAPASRLKRMRHSMSLFVTYFGTRKSYPKLVHHNVMFGSRYRELLSDIFDRGVLADDFSLYVHAPTLSDPSLAPPGGQAFYALSPVPHLGKGKIDWEKTGPEYARRIVEYLDRRYMPGLAGDIVTQRIFTPRDFESRLGAHLGSAFSLEPTLTQSAWFRVHNRDRHIGGLYFVGAGTHPGAGIPGVIGSAKATVSTLLADLGLEGSAPVSAFRAVLEGARG